MGSIFSDILIRKLLKGNTSIMASKESIIETKKILEESLKNITQKSLEFMRHADRMKITKQDVEMALKN